MSDASTPGADIRFLSANQFDREGSYSDKSDREPIKPASQKSAKAAKREAMAASLKAEKAGEHMYCAASPTLRFLLSFR